jgi:hypothetical protein
MASAAQQNRDPFVAAVNAQDRLFTTRPIFLGVEESLRHPKVPCGLHTDAERARHVRKRFREMVNSKGAWEPLPEPRAMPLRDIFAQRNGSLENPSPQPSLLGRGEGDRAVGPSTTEVEPAIASPALLPALTVPQAVEKVGVGTLCIVSHENGSKVYGRALTVAERLDRDRVLIAKWIRRLTNWTGRQATLELWDQKIVPLIEQRLAEQKTPVTRFVNQDHKILAEVSIADLTMRAYVDSLGVALWRPPQREVFPYDCAQCSLVETCKQLPTSTGTALLWRRLKLIDAAGVPTPRGRMVSFFSQGDGLAIAAALEDETYPLDELIYDLSNLDAGFRFCGEDNRWAGRLAAICHENYGLQSVAGYLENGVPPKYGAGAEQVVASVHKNPMNKHAWVTDLLGPGDIDRIIIEWRSLLRQISHAPDLEWPRWRELQKIAKAILNETESPTMKDLPPLDYHQTRRVDHRLLLRRH